MQHAVDMHGLHRGALQRRQQNSPQRVAERHAEAAFERLRNDGRHASRIGAGADLQLAGPDQFLPILLDRHVITHRVARRERVARPCPLRGAKISAMIERRQMFDFHNMSYTRRRLRGRHPLCGIGVTSRIEVMVKPAACSERSADSRPEPGPATSTSSVRMPCS